MNTKIHSQHPWAWLIVMFTALLLTACGGGSGGNGGPITGGTTGDPTPPPVSIPLTISSTSPADKTTGVASNTALAVTFNSGLKASTIESPATSFTLVESATGNIVPGTVRLDTAGTTAVFIPDESLMANTQYTGTISTAAQNNDNSSLVNNHAFSFTTGAPAVVFTNPANATTGLPINSKIIATFSAGMNPTTLTSPATSFTVRNTTTSAPVAGIVTYDARSNSAIFTPTTNLSASTNYTAVVTT